MADEVEKLSKYRKAQKTFGKLFLISFSVFFIFLLISPFFFYLNSADSKLPEGTAANTNSASFNKSSNSSTVPKPYPTKYGTPEKTPPVLIPVSGNDSGFPVFLTVAVVVGFFSFFAAVFTFLGFLTMTIFAWRKEKRESAGFRLESQKKQIEIEKLKVELEKSKTSFSGKYKKCMACKRTYADVSLNFCLNDGAVLSEVYDSKDFGQNPFENTQVMQGNLPTEQISAKTEEIENKNTAK